MGKNKKQLPKDFIWPFTPGENGLTMGKRRWDMSTLVAAAENQEEFELDLLSIDLSRYPWKFEDWCYMSFLFHFKRCQEANLKYPIILSPEGYIVDGWHRVAKAIMKGDTVIKAKRLKVMPDPDEVLE